jgi:parallel beta-helix repeat protein
MKKLLIIIIFISPFTTFALFKEVKITKNMRITSSVKIIKGSYLINGFDSLKDAIITIEGNNITVDFNNTELKGSNNKKWPNDFYGTAIIIKGGKNITLKNANIHGYKVAVMGTDVENLVIQNCNFSYNYRQQLHSSRLEEDVSDWMSYHHNENDEWLRYGAGIYLRNCNKVNIHNNNITGGQCGLMMTNCNDGIVYDNNFSFNSGIGIGLYRSSRNKILHNQLDFNVRGYSDGIFNRGQDSAGLLVFEQSSNNTFAYNSVTHSGDGFFLWAGQYTMDTGEGGCNDNIVYKNDFSYAPTNGVEVTFSKNYIRDNVIKECDNGIWGGYSFISDISLNKIEKNTVGIAIEHGQDNEIVSNSFNSNKTAIKLWARRSQPSDWGYAKYRDTRSKNYYIIGNKFINNKKPIDVMLTDTITICELPDSINKQLHFDTTVKHVNISACDLTAKPGYFEKFTKLDKQILQLTKQPKDYKLDKHPGRKEIRITQWGPYDYLYPILWLTKVDSSGKMFFDILGQKGKWTIKNFKGVKNISSSKGGFP